MLNLKQKKITAFAVFCAMIFTYFSMFSEKTAKAEAGTQKTFMDSGREVDSYYYTANEGGSVSKIDAQTNKVVHTFTVDGTAHNVQVSPNGKIVGVTVAAANGPHGFRISKDGKYAYIANMGEDTVSVIDIINYNEIKRIKVGKTPVTTGITSNGKTLAATINAENSLTIIDTIRGNIRKVVVGNGPAQVYISPDDKYAFVANQGIQKNPSNTVSKIDLSTKKVVATIPVGKGAHGVVISSDNKYE